MKTLLTLALSLATLLSIARADHDDHRDNRRVNRVILFQDADFRGGALVLFPGDSLDNFSGRTFDNGAKLNDGVSSIRVEGDVEAYAYQDARFRGEALRLTDSVRDLTGRFVAGGVGVTWNDRISSLKVVWQHGREPQRGPDHGPGRGDPDKTIKLVFDDMLGRAPNSSEQQLFRSRLTSSGWDERMLRDYLSTQNSYRNEAANRIVRRAYLDVLGREPDASGLNSYRDKVLSRNWTESDVKEDLRKSAEYRNKHH